MSTIDTTVSSHAPDASRFADIPRVALQVSRDVVVASIQVDLDEDVLARFRDELLRRVHETGSRGVILDLSGLETLDSTEFCALRDITRITGLMGAESVLAGLRPGVVSALIQAGADVDGLRSAIDLDAAFILLQPEPESPADAGTEDEPGTDTESETDISQHGESSPAPGVMG